MKRKNEKHYPTNTGVTGLCKAHCLHERWEFKPAFFPTEATPQSLLLDCKYVRNSLISLHLDSTE